MGIDGNNAFDGVADYRYNPFDQTFSPNPIGYSGNPAEKYDIPTVGPYYVYLRELPRQDLPSTLIVKDADTGVPYTEVARSVPPAAGQFRAIYGGDGITPTGEPGQGILEFHSSDAARVIAVQYYGLGTITQRATLDRALNNPIESLNYLAGNVVVVGGNVQAQIVPDFTVEVSAGEAIVGGKKVTWRLQNSAAIPPPTGNPRYDLIVVDSDGDILHLQGAESADPVFPAVLATQRPLAYLKMTVGMPSITNATIVKIPLQGVMAVEIDRVKWYFTLAAALTGGITKTPGIFYVRPGDYFEEVDLTAWPNVSIYFDRGVTLYRISDSSTAIKMTYAGSTPITSGMRLIGPVRLHGNSKAGSASLLLMTQRSTVEISGMIFGDNSGSSATFKDAVITDSNDFLIDAIITSRANFSVEMATCSRYKVNTNEKRILPANVMAAVYTPANLYAALSPYLLNIGDSCGLSGSMFASTFATGSPYNALFFFSSMTRISSTQIRLYGMTLALQASLPSGSIFAGPGDFVIPTDLASSVGISLAIMDN